MSKRRKKKNGNRRNTTVAKTVGNAGNKATGVTTTDKSIVKEVASPADVKWEPLNASCGCAGSDMEVSAELTVDNKAFKNIFTLDHLKAMWRKLWKSTNGRVLLILCFCIIVQCVCMLIWSNANKAKSKALIEALTTETVEVTEPVVTAVEPVVDVFLPTTTVNKYDIIDDGLVHNMPIDGTMRGLLQSIVGDNTMSWYKKADYIGFADFDNTGVPEFIIWDDKWHYTVYKINLEDCKLEKWQTFEAEGSVNFGYYRDTDSALNVWVGTVNGDKIGYEVFLFNDTDLVRENVSKSDFRDTYTLIGADNLFVRSKRLDENSNYTAVIQTLLDLYYD